MVVQDVAQGVADAHVYHDQPIVCVFGPSRRGAICLRDVYRPPVELHCTQLVVAMRDWSGGQQPPYHIIHVDVWLLSPVVRLFTQLLEGVIPEGSTGCCEKLCTHEVCPPLKWKHRCFVWTLCGVASFCCIRRIFLRPPPSDALSHLPRSIP